MDERESRLYIKEVHSQASFALFAWSDYFDAFRSEDIDRVWFAVQNFLIASANVSKLLWTPSKRTVHQERSAWLRSLLQVADDSPLSNRSLRNHLEHFDERIWEWAAENPTQVVDQIIGDPVLVSMIDPRNVLRSIGRDGMTWRFRGEEFAVGPAITELRRLQRRAGEEFAASMKRARAAKRDVIAFGGGRDLPREP